MTENIKLITETNKGNLVKVPATIERKDGRIYFIKSPFALKNEIKAMKGSKWHGFLENDGRKIWSIEDCTRNNFQLEFMMGGNPYANWDQDLIEREYERQLFEKQRLMTDHILTYHYVILAAEMGCISGDAVVNCNRAGKGFQITLKELYSKWINKKDHNGKLGQKSWDSSISTYVRSMKDGVLGLHKLINVIDKGFKETIKITLESGKSLVCTPDHEIYINHNICLPAEELRVGDTVITNGFVPKNDTIISIEKNEKTRVFDLVMDDPHRNFVVNGFIVHNCGKTLSAIEAMERSNATEWWWVGPKSAIAAVEREFIKWGFKAQPRIMTYDRLRIDMERWADGNPAPQGVIFDESSKCKSEKSKRTKAAQHLADSIRKEWDWNGYVILMSGTPAPKSPVDWWSQCEICYPGFVREGSSKSFERRLAVFQKKEIPTQGTIWKRAAWLDDEKKCAVCGQYEDHENHNSDDLFGTGEDAHEYQPSKNEVSYLYKRLKGLVLPISKKDCYDIPDKIYREVVLKPSNTIKRVAKALVSAAPTTIQGLTWLRELSDGFQYREVQQGEKICPVCNGEGQCYQWTDDKKEHCECDTCSGSGRVANMVRETKQIKTPKDTALIDLLEENEDIGRVLIFAGFQGSIDRIINICHKQQWNVVKVDGRGWKSLPCTDEKVPKNVKPLDYWYDSNNSRVAFVAHPASGGMGLTLTEASMAVFYSNDFTPESRAQAEDRIHRPGIDANRGATIVDLFHLGTDRKVRDVLLDNRRLETMTLGEVQKLL